MALRTISKQILNKHLFEHLRNFVPICFAKQKKKQTTKNHFSIKRLPFTGEFLSQLRDLSLNVFSFFVKDCSGYKYVPLDVCSFGNV